MSHSYPEHVRALLTPRMLGAHLLALVCVGLACSLGYWQYDAWQARRSAEAVDLTRLEPVPLADVLGPDDPFPGDRVGQPVELAGSWLPEGTVLVSGREHDGREGYWVVTPLTAGATDAPAVPVVRGWVASADEAPAPPTGEATVVGWLQPPDGTGEADDDAGDDVLPQVRIADLIQRVDQDLYGAYAVLDPEPGDAAMKNAGTDGLEPADLEELPPAGRFTALRNLLYAIEWLVFGAFAAFIWWRYVREELEATSPTSPGGPAALATGEHPVRSEP